MDFEAFVIEKLNKIDDKLDSTCDRLTAQETNYKNHIDSEKAERENNDKKIDRKYQFWTVILGGISTVLAALEIKRYT